MTVAPFVVFATGGVEATLPASMARGARLMSLLMGMFERNLVPSLMTGSVKPSGGILLICNPPSNRFPSMGILWAWLEVGLN